MWLPLKNTKCCRTSPNPMILHIPHSSQDVPADLRDQFVVSNDELLTELRRLTDAFTDALFALPGATSIRFPVSRVVVDPERFPDDAQEPMSKVGMGMIYTRTADGKPLRRPLEASERQTLINRYYTPHHHSLTQAVDEELKRHGQALIIDCHSFPNTPLPFELDQAIPRPDFCIGTDPFHTPGILADLLVACIRDLGYSVKLNSPYAGALVPMAFYQKDRRVSSVLIEVNRRLYMNELTGEKITPFALLQRQILALLSNLS